MTEQTPDKCPVCHKTMNAYSMGEANEHTLIACRACGSVMAHPWVTEDEREKFFGDIQPEITHVPFPDKEITNIQTQILKITQKNATGKSFLDVNCRNGYAVEAASKLGMKPYGIDPHDFFIRFAQSKYDTALFENTSVPEFAESGKKFDVVYAREAFCEQNDLEGFVKNLARLVADDGILYIEEPDGNNFNVPSNFGSWSLVFPPMNFVYLSKKGMNALLGRHGLRIQKIFFNWKPLMRMIVTKE